MTGLRVEAQDGGRVVLLTIDRPERGNSLTIPLLRALDEVVSGLAAGGARAAVITGAGAKAFSTGYDVEALQAELAAVLATEGAVPLDPATHPLERALAAITASPVPLVAAIRGGATGAGLELACACDLRVVGRGARFLMPPARLGVVYSATGIARLMGLVGAGAARELFYAAEAIDAARAHALGLATRLSDDATVLDDALALARRIASLAPLAVGGMKSIIERHLAAPALDAKALDEIAAIRLKAFRSHDLQEGVSAFLERREARFEGR